MRREEEINCRGIKVNRRRTIIWDKRERKR